MCWALCRELYIASRGILAGEADAESDAGVKWGGGCLGINYWKRDRKEAGADRGSIAPQKALELESSSRVA